MNALDYILKANLYGLLLAGCYWLLLRRHTFFGLNRAYLLASVVLSLLMPLVSLPTRWTDRLAAAPVPAPIMGVIALPAATGSAEFPTAPTPIPGPSPDWEKLGEWVYVLVAVALLSRLLFGISRVYRLIRRSPRQKRADYILVEPTRSDSPTFSFFRYLVLNPADAGSELIIRHERVHIRQLHSLDVLVVAAIRAVFWVCPALWLMERALRQVHEFQADRGALRQPDAALTPDEQPDAYARFLVNYTFGVRHDSLTNGFFNPSLLKQRILMLRQRATNRWALVRYALIAPLVLSLLAMTTTRQEFSVDTTLTPDATTGITAPNEDPATEAAATYAATRSTSVQPATHPPAEAVTRRKLTREAPAPQRADSVRPLRRASVEKPASQTMSPARPFNIVVNNHPNARFTMYNDVNPRQIAPPDSTPTPRASQGFDDEVHKLLKVSPGDYPTTRSAVSPHLLQLDPASTRIRIKGKGPTGMLGEEPLYLIDGVEVAGADIKTLDPNSILSIDVLKGAAATATYGPRAADGAIIITTRKR